MDFIFESQQTIQFEVLDIDKGSSDLIGTVETTVSKIVGSRNSIQLMELTSNNKKTGTIIVRAEQTKNCSDILQIQFKATFKKNRMFGFGDTKGKLVLNRIMQNQQKVKLRESEWYRTNEPVYNMFEITLQKLCLGDKNRETEIELWDHHHSKEDSFMGKGKFTLKQITDNEKVIELLNT